MAVGYLLESGTGCALAAKGQRAISLRAVCERKIGFSLPLPAVWREWTRETTRRLATSQITAHPATKGATHWATKQLVFENVIFLGILLSVQ